MLRTPLQRRTIRFTARCSQLRWIHSPVASAVVGTAGITACRTHRWRFGASACASALAWHQRLAPPGLAAHALAAAPASCRVSSLTTASHELIRSPCAVARAAPDPSLVQHRLAAHLMSSHTAGQGQAGRPRWCRTTAWQGAMHSASCTVAPVGSRQPGVLVSTPPDKASLRTAPAAAAHGDPRMTEPHQWQGTTDGCDCASPQDGGKARPRALSGTSGRLRNWTGEKNRLGGQQ